MDENILCASMKDKDLLKTMGYMMYLMTDFEELKEWFVTKMQNNSLNSVMDTLHADMFLMQYNKRV